MPTAAQQSKSLKILFDGNCVVCDLEVMHYKKIAPHLIQVVDISHPDFKAENYRLTTEAVNKHLHVVDSDGHLYVGVKAFSKIWETIPKYNWAHQLIEKKAIFKTAELGYEVFVVVRPYLPKKTNRFFFF